MKHFLWFLLFVIATNNAFSQAANYGFTALSGSYTALIGATNTSIASTDNNNISSSVAIPFTFNFAGTNYTSVKVSSDGWLTFNTSINVNYQDNTTDSQFIQPVLMPLFDNLQCRVSPRYLTTGNFPNRIFTIEWYSMEWNRNANNDVIGFQIKLYETTNVIDFVYRQGVTPINNGNGGATIGIQDANSTFLTLNNSSTNPTAQKLTFTTNILAKPANGQIYRFTPPVPISISPSVASICDGDSVTLTASSSNINYTYEWSPAFGLNTTSGASVIASPGSSQVYTVTGTDNTMQFSQNITVSNNSPDDVNISNVNSNVCPNIISNLTTNGWSSTTDTLIDEDFTLPTGWLQYNGSVGGTPEYAEWMIYADGEVYGIHSNDNSDFIMSDSNAQGIGGITYTILYAPTIDLTNFTTVNLKFYQYYRDYDADDEAKVQVSIDGGTSWADLVVYTSTQGSATSFLETNISLDSYIGFNDVKIRFEYFAFWGYYWALDNVSITGTRPNITWTALPVIPNTLFTDASCSTPYTAGNHAQQVYVNPSVTTTYTANTAIGSCSKTDTVTLTVETAVYNGSWSPALATNQSIEINADYTLATDMDVCACKINSGKKLTVPSATTLTVQNGIDNAGEIVVDHTGSLVQVNETDTNTGAGVYKIKKTTGTYKNYDYFYWSSPVENETVGTVLPTVNYKYKFNPANYLDVKSGHGYPQPTASIPGDGYDDNGDDWSYLSNSTIMPKGIGFIAMGKDSPTSFSVGQMGVSQAAFDVTFEGEKIHNGTFTAEVKQDAYNVSPGYNPNNNNLNLLGNPYPSAIDVFELYHDNASVLEGKFYFWTHDAQLAAISGPNAYDFDNNNFAIGAVTGTYPSYTYTQTLSGTGKSAPRYIASTQGFMASAIDGIASTSNVTYKNSMRATGNNNTFFRQASDIPQVSRLWLNMTGANSFNQIAVGFDISTSDTYGMGDAPRVASAANTDFYSIIQEVNGAFAIQFLSDFQDNKMVPLGISVLNQGTFEISLDHADGIFTQGQKIYLEDTYEDVIHNLNEGAYSFTQTAGTKINDRFILRFTNSALGHEDTALSQVKVYPNPSTGVFNVSYQGSATLQYTVYDLTGKTILSGTGNQIDLSHQAIGMYFATITDGSAVRSLKLVRE